MKSFVDQRGLTLFVGLMFLLMLSLVAVVALQGTSLELKMSTTQAQQMTSSQASESARLMVGKIVDANVNHDGMNRFTGAVAGFANMGSGGMVSAGSGLSSCTGAALNTLAQPLMENNDFTYSPAYSSTLHTISGVFLNDTASATAANIAGNPNKMMCANFGCPGGAATCANPVATAWANAYTIGTRVNPGYAQNIGSGGLGGAQGCGGTNKWFEIRSQGQVGTGARTVTTAEFRHLNCSSSL